MVYFSFKGELIIKSNPVISDAVNNTTIDELLKHNVYLAMLRKQAIVTNACEFYEAALRFVQKISLLFDDIDDINNKAPFFRRFWDGVRPAQDIKKAWCVRVIDIHKVGLYRLSRDTEPMDEKGSLLHRCFILKKTKKP